MPHSQLMNPKNVVLELKLVFLIIISRTLYCVCVFFFFLLFYATVSVVIYSLFLLFNYLPILDSSNRAACDLF